MNTLLNPNASAEGRSADNILQRIREMGCTSALIRNSTKLVTMCKASGLEVIYRAAGDDQAGNPLAQSAASFVLSRYRAAPDADYIHLTNEIGFPAGLVEWDEIAALTAESVGKRVVAINPGTNATVADWRRVESHLKWLTGRGHQVGAHLYLDGEHDDGGWAQLDYLKSIGVHVLITEWGLIESITRDDVGWRRVLGADPSRYAVWHDARAAKLASYGYPAYLFSIDHWRDDDFGKANGFGTEDKPEFTKHCAVINAKYPIQEQTPMPDIPAPTTGGVKAKLTKVPQDFINVRHQPNGNDVGDLLVGDVVTYYPDAPVIAANSQWVYQTPLTPTDRPEKRQNAAAGWVSLQDGKVVFETLVDPPPVEPEPPAEETVEITVAERDTMLAEQEALVVSLRAAIVNAENTIALLRGAKLPMPAFTLSYPVANPVIIQPFGGNTTGVADFYTKYGLPAHEGVDFKAPAGTPVLACAAGVINRIERVEFTGSGSPYGIQIRITHQWGDQEYETIYAHLQSVGGSLKVGDVVTRGQQVGLSNNTGNSTGAHLHLALKRKGATDRGEKQKLGDGTMVTYPSDLVDPTPLLTA